VGPWAIVCATQTVRCLVQLGHARPCYALVARALKEAELANDSLAAAQLLHSKVGVRARGSSAVTGAWLWLMPEASTCSHLLQCEQCRDWCLAVADA